MRLRDLARRGLPIVAGLAVAVPALAQSRTGWQHLGAVRADGSRVSSVFAEDSGIRLGLSCDRGRLVPFALPVPPGAAETVRVEFSNRHWRREGPWRVDQARLVADPVRDGDIAKYLAEMLLSDRGELRLRIADGPTVTFAAAGAKDLADRLLRGCRQ